MDESYSREHNTSRIKDILSDLFEVGELAHIYRNRDTYFIWGQICPEKFIDLTRVKGVYRKTVTIEVSSSATLQEISTFYRTEILEKLKQIKGNKIDQILFKLGSFGPPAPPPS
ncbi:MAG: DciA family protein [Planctomycetota bacterium]